MPIIYVAINKINGKRYIGATSRSLLIRRRAHIWDATRGKAVCKVFHAAIRKYGPEAFEWRELLKCETWKDTMEAEIKIIAETKPEYNITRGGQGVVGIPYTEERRKKLSIAHKGRKRTPEQIARMKAADRSSFFKPVVCLQDGKWFESGKAAAQFYGINSKIVGLSARGTQTHSHGLSFVFSPTPLSQEQCDEHMEKLRNRRVKEKKRIRSGIQRRPVVCVNTGKWYGSAKAAALEYGICNSRVCQICKNGRPTKKGLMFRWADSEAVVPVYETPEQLAKRRKASIDALVRGQQKIKKRVICLDTNVLYDSISDAARSIGAHISGVSDSIYRQGRAKGHAFCFLDEWCPNPL